MCGLSAMGGRCRFARNQGGGAYHLSKTYGSGYGFWGIEGFGEVVPLEPQSHLVFFEIPVDSSRAYPEELFRDFSRDTEDWRVGDAGHLLPHERGDDLRNQRFRPHLYQKNVQTRPRQWMTLSVEIRLPFRLAGHFFSGLSLTGLPSA